MSNIFSGTCVGGPLDGQSLAHWAREKALYRSMMVSLVRLTAVEIGEYRLNDFGQWHWWPTGSGEAMEKLFGPAGGP